MDQLSPLILAAILGLVLLGGAWLLVRRRQQMRSPNHGRSRQAQSDELDTVASWEPSATRVLTASEREAYHILRKALPEHNAVGPGAAGPLPESAHPQLLQRMDAPGGIALRRPGGVRHPFTSGGRDRSSPTSGRQRP